MDDAVLQFLLLPTIVILVEKTLGVITLPNLLLLENYIFMLAGILVHPTGYICMSKSMAKY